MQLKLLCHGEQINCRQPDNSCETVMCSRELMLKVLKSLVRPQLMPVISRIFEVEELFRLADLVCLGENQLYHVIRMCEHASRLKDSYLADLGLERENLITSILFHDCGKGREIDDSVFRVESRKMVKVPRKLKQYGIPNWAEYYVPLHDHIERSLEIAETYKLNSTVLEAVALHHHVKIFPEVMGLVTKGLCLPKVFSEDILQHRVGQYAARGTVLAQVVAIIDQVCAIERKFEGRVYLAREPEKMEEELVKDLVIGVTDSQDPRVGLLNNKLDGNETVILFDISNFGNFVRENSEYRVQGVKREVLTTIRSVVRVQDHHREKDLVGLVGGDEYAVITKVRDDTIINKMINRIRGSIKNRVGLKVRYGYAGGETIVENFHQARSIANRNK